MDRTKIKILVENTIKEHLTPQVVVGVSNRHIHLSEKDKELLFGDVPLIPIKPLLAGNFAAEQTVTIKGPKGFFNKVRVLGPCRSITQVEVSLTDTFTLGIKAPVAESGDLSKAAEMTIENPLTRVSIVRKAAIIALRHIHTSPEFGLKYGIKDKSFVKVRFEGERALTFEQVLIRIQEDFTDEMHIDIDEANSGGIKSGDFGRILLI